MLKNLIIKALSMTLMLSMFCIAFVGCLDSSNTPAETTRAAETTTDSTPEPDNTPKPEEEPVEGGIDLTEYCIVRSKEAATDVRTAASIFKNFLSVYCGVEIEIKTDDKPETAKEILFGTTNRKESNMANLTLKNTDWSIELIDEKIVLSAGYNSDIVYTTNYLVENCLNKNSKYIVLGETPVLSEKVTVNDALSLTFNGNEANSVKVALLSDGGTTYLDNAGFADAALLLADSIRTSSNANTTVGKYDPSSSAFQIVIGSEQYGRIYLPAGVSVGNMQYAICKKANSIVIIAKTEMGAEIAAQEIIRAINQKGKGVLELNTLCKDTPVTYTYNGNIDLEKGADCRIMSYNIERVELNTKDRSELHMNNILFYNPDIIGFQEFCTDLKLTLGIKLQRNGYTMVEPIPEKYNDADSSCASRYSMYNNYTPIAYKTEKYELLNSGAKRIIPSKTSGNSIQGSYGWPGYTCTWAVLKDKATGEIFAVTSLHNKTGSASTDAQKKIVSLGMVKTIVDKIVKDYSCPVIMVGDYNSKQSMADYKSFVTAKNGIYDSRYVAERGYAAGNSHASSPTCPSSEAIDHIFVTGNLRVLRHRHGHAVSVASASDHKPVFIDVMIGETPIGIDTTPVFEGFNSQKIIKGINLHAIKPENIAIKKMSE